MPGVVYIDASATFLERFLNRATESYASDASQVKVVVVDRRPWGCELEKLRQRYPDHVKVMSLVVQPGETQPSDIANRILELVEEGDTLVVDRHLGVEQRDPANDNSGQLVLQQLRHSIKTDNHHFVMMSSTASVNDAGPREGRRRLEVIRRKVTGFHDKEDWATQLVRRLYQIASRGKLPLAEFNVADVTRLRRGQDYHLVGHCLKFGEWLTRTEDLRRPEHQQGLADHVSLLIEYFPRLVSEEVRAWHPFVEARQRSLNDVVELAPLVAFGRKRLNEVLNGGPHCTGSADRNEYSKKIIKPIPGLLAQEEFAAAQEITREVIGCCDYHRSLSLLDRTVVAIKKVLTLPKLDTFLLRLDQMKTPSGARQFRRDEKCGPVLEDSRDKEIHCHEKPIFDGVRRGAGLIPDLFNCWLDLGLAEEDIECSYSLDSTRKGCQISAAYHNLWNRALPITGYLNITIAHDKKPLRFDRQGRLKLRGNALVVVDSLIGMGLTVGAGNSRRYVCFGPDGHVHEGQRHVQNGDERQWQARFDISIPIL